MKISIKRILVALFGLGLSAPASIAAVVTGPIINPASGHSYYLLSPNTWTASEAEAVTLGGHLVTINDLAENEWVFNTFSRSGQYALWIGLNDQVSEGNFVWSSGATEPFRNWAALQPDNAGNEDFGMIFVEENGQPSARARRWNDFRNTAFENNTSGGVLQGVVEVALQDLVAMALTWNSTMGGLDARYRVDHGALTTATTAKLFWANGTSLANVLPGPPIFTENIPVGTGGPGLTGVRTFHVLGNRLRNAPTGTTHILLVVDPDKLLTGDNEANNVAPLPDVQITFGPNANQAVVSDLTRRVVKDALRYAGEAAAEISSTSRTIEEQARVMYEVLEGPFNPKTMGKKGCTTTLCYSYQLYDLNGEQVLDTYVASKAAGKTPTEIQADMTMKIRAIKATKPTAFKHTADPNVLNVVDIKPSTIENWTLFNLATSPSTDSRIARRFSPLTSPQDTAFHLEIPQGGALLLVGDFEGAGGDVLVAGEDVVDEEPLPIPLPGGLPPLSPFIPIDTASGFGMGSGTVSTGHIVFTFDASSGDLLRLGVDVTTIRPGTTYTDEDSMLFLFDSGGHLLASNDDTDPFETVFESQLEDFSITNSGRHYVVVTTFSNSPLLDGSGVIIGWEEDGGSEIDFEMFVSVASRRIRIEPLEDGTFVVSWDYGGVLEEAHNVTGPWMQVIEAVSPYAVSGGAPKFFRFRR